MHEEDYLSWGNKPEYAISHLHQTIQDLNALMGSEDDEFVADWLRTYGPNIKTLLTRELLRIQDLKRENTDS